MEDKRNPKVVTPMSLERPMDDGTPMVLSRPSWVEERGPVGSYTVAQNPTPEVVPEVVPEPAKP